MWLQWYLHWRWELLWTFFHNTRPSVLILCSYYSMVAPTTERKPIVLVSKHSSYRSIVIARAHTGQEQFVVSLTPSTYCVPVWWSAPISESWYHGDCLPTQAYHPLQNMCTHHRNATTAALYRHQPVSIISTQDGTMMAHLYPQPDCENIIRRIPHRSCSFIR